MSGKGGHIGGLERHRRSDLVLDREVPTHGVGRDVVKLDSAKRQTIRIHSERSQRRATEASF